MLTLIFCGLLFLAGGTEALHNVNKYSAPRDYLSVKSENYPAIYPAGNSFTWQWTTPAGHWGLVFEDFDVACTDALKIFDPASNKTIIYRCKNTPLEFYFGSNFSMTLIASSRRVDPSPRGFKCQVFYGRTKEEVELKVNARKTSPETDKSDEDDSPSISGTVIALIVVIVVFIVAISVVVCVIKRRQQHLQTTNTSVHVNIDGIRRASAVSYTRTGGGRARLESVDSVGPDNQATTPKRPVKRSESNASWAERATSTRHGSCSSSTAADNPRGGGATGGGGGGGRANAKNFYFPFPVTDTDTHPDNDDDDKDLENLGISLGQEPPGFTPRFRSRSASSASGRLGSSDGGIAPLSSIFEEPGYGKLEAGFPGLGVQIEGPSIAISNGGYIVMTSCTTADYINYDGE